MDTNVMATVLTGVGVLLGVWRLVGVAVDGVRKDLTAEIHLVHRRIDAVDQRIDGVNQRIDGVNQRIDTVLLAARNAPGAS